MSHPITPLTFASAAQPVAADTLIITDDQGLVAGDITIPTADGVIPGYRARPDTTGALPVVLVIQEIFGLHEHIRDVARRLAKLGYLAVAPALYHRQGDVSKLPTVEAIREVVARVPDAQVLSDLDASLAWADANGADAARVAVTGFCWGGRMTWLYAAHQARLKAAVAWYGRLAGETSTRSPRHVVDVLGELKAPVLGLYGGQDPSIPLAVVEQVNTSLASLASPSRIEVYPNSPHAFYADYRTSYRGQDATDGWQRLRHWLREHGV